MAVLQHMVSSLVSLLHIHLVTFSHLPGVPNHAPTWVMYEMPYIYVVTVTV